MAREQVHTGKHGGSKQATSKQSTSKQGGAKAKSPVQVQKFLSGLDYPVDKQQILQKAKEEGADESVMSALNRLPERRFESPVSISKEIGQLH